MKYFIDTEFLEGTQDKRLLGIKYGKTLPTIDLISIGIVDEDNNIYYAISKDFNLWEAWNRHDEKVNIDYTPSREESHYNPMYIKEYWIRDNVLKPIFNNLLAKEEMFITRAEMLSIYIDDKDYKFNYKDFKKLLNKYGKSREQIAEEILEFTKSHIDNNINFYGYYADYDWVVFCWLFGKMIDLPNGFPMYCNDLKQMFNERAYRYTWNNIDTIEQKQIDMKEWIEGVKNHPNYPKQTDEHCALYDAIWNKKLYEFLNKLS